MKRTTITSSEKISHLVTDSIIKVILYFDIFHYPVTKQEILFFSQEKHPKLKSELDNSLSYLLKHNLIYQFGEFYSAQNDPDLMLRRVKGNQLAVSRKKTAHLISKLISWFPYVRAVMISGSLSKEYMEKNSDIDFFIITAPNRLWITRMLLILFKRLFLFNSYKNFCINYLIDIDHLEIEEKNLFTAMEIITLIPTYGKSQYLNFFAANEWVLDVLPNSEPRSTVFIKGQIPFIQRITEWLLNNKFGDQLDRYFMKVTLSRWKSLHGRNYSKEDFDLAFKTRRYVSKHHPKFYQKKILKAYKQKISTFQKSIDLNSATS